MEENRVYLFFDRISPRLRGVVSIILIVAGFLLQLSTKNILVGMPLILLCVVINLIKGISIRRPQPVDSKWQEVTPDRIDQVLQQCRRVKKFKSQNLGCFIIAVLVLLFMGVFLFPLWEATPLPFAGTVTVVNAVVLFGGLVISGRRSAWLPRALDMKAEIIKRVTELPIVRDDPRIKVAPYLEIGQTAKGNFPGDIRVLLKFNDAPETFIGIQAQISINTVKSTMYPYLYTVIIARPEFALFDKFKSLQVTPDRIAIETKRADNVDVIVIRQTTTKTSGYHTNSEAQQYILSKSIEFVKRML